MIPGNQGVGDRRPQQKYPDLSQEQGYPGRRIQEFHLSSSTPSTLVLGVASLSGRQRDAFPFGTGASA